MKEIKKNIEQLELVGELIDKNTSNNSRLALFLIDNFAELMMYKYVIFKFAYDAEYKYVKRNYNLTPRKKGKIREYFDEKVNFLINDIKKINLSDGYILKVCHKLRNEAYHNGIHRDRIIKTVTRSYFQTICKIYPDLWLGSYGSSSSDDFKDFFNKYKINFYTFDREVLVNICSTLAENRDCSAGELAEAISEDLIFRIENIIGSEDMNGGLEILSSAPGGKSPEDILKWMQFREKEIVDFNCGPFKNDEDFREFWRMVDVELKKYNPKVTIKTFKTWIKKAEILSNEKYKGLILNKFWDIDKQFIKIENLVDEACVKYDMEIDRQIHP